MRNLIEVRATYVAARSLPWAFWAGRALEEAAMAGRVYVWADASEHPIQPGDLLTTADLPGHAMKVTDYERAQGAIIGKAMSALDEGH